MLNATERKVLTVSTFVAACICFAPGDMVSGGMLLVASLALVQYDRVMLRREDAAAPKPAAGAEPQATADEASASSAAE
jgi:hypothetical protein